MEGRSVFPCPPLDTDNLSEVCVAHQTLDVPSKIAKWALETPDAPAVVQPGKKASFAELNSLANTIAANLRDAGVLRGVLVAIVLESSIEFVAAAFGIWKAGAAYLPMDPAYPTDRATHILSDAGVEAVITRRALAERLKSRQWATLVIEDLQPQRSAEDASISSDDLAYVIYTSGSTGEPNGVEITHGNLSNLLEWHNREFLVTGDDRATQIASPGFDAAVWEIWPNLAAGASIYLPAPEARLSGVLLRDWLVAERITISFAPTVLAEELLGLAWPASTSLRYLLTGGDALHTFPPEDLPFQLVNNYGPTECTVVATSAMVTASAGGRCVPAIGRAISNTSTYLLDESQRPVPEGDAGELYLCGASVGRGYRRRAALTADRFVHIDISGESKRAFRTGDLARRLPDGQLTFLGRVDDQIKIRGFRIEPDEIASVLNRNPFIVSSAVIARNDSGEKRLVAYVVQVEGAEIWEHDLRESLTRHLPEYMVPSHFVLICLIPVTPNGKLDKAALPAPAEHNQARRNSCVEPRNEVEEIVEGMVASVLRLDRVSIYDHFFMLGGHSLMGAQLIAKLRDAFGVELVLRDIFESPTVAKLAARVEALLTAKLEAMSDEEVDEMLRANLTSEPESTPSPIEAD